MTACLTIWRPTALNLSSSQGTAQSIEPSVLLMMTTSAGCSHERTAIHAGWENELQVWRLGAFVRYSRIGFSMRPELLKNGNMIRCMWPLPIMLSA
jgi:hypothetical protein